MLDAIIDISHHNHGVDFAKVKAGGVEAVILKASQGVSGVDPTFAVNRRKALDAGLLVGAYHFATGGDVIQQAAHFYSVVQPDKQTLLVLDYEPNPAGTTMIAKAAERFIEEIKNETGKSPVLYTGAAMADKLGIQGVADCPLWWARYRTEIGQVPAIWPTWTLHQYTDGMHPHPVFTEGAGFVDRSRFNGDLAGLKRLWGA